MIIYNCPQFIIFIPQLQPVLGRHIFQQPKCQEYHPAYGDGTDTLWQSFEVVILTENHRQGEDRQFADIFNRIRIVKQTEEDMGSLLERVRPASHPDIQADNTKICSTREEASEFNTQRLNKISGRLFSIEARHICKTKKNYKPILKKGGKIADTQFEDILNIKV